MQRESLKEKGVKCFRTIKKYYSSTTESDSDENSDTELVSFTIDHDIVLNAKSLAPFEIGCFKITL